MLRASTIVAYEQISITFHNSQYRCQISQYQTFLDLQHVSDKSSSGSSLLGMTSMT